MHLLRSQKEWNDVGPQDKMGSYNALKDPHLRQLHGGRRSRAHLRKMKEAELQSKENLDAAAKLAWRRDVHKLYGGMNVYKEGRRRPRSSASRSASPGGRASASAPSKAKANREDDGEETPSCVASSYAKHDDEPEDEKSPSVISDRFGDGPEAPPPPPAREDRESAASSRSRSRSPSLSVSSRRSSHPSSSAKSSEGAPAPAAAHDGDEQSAASASSSYRSDEGAGPEDKPGPAASDSASDYSADDAPAATPDEETPAADDDDDDDAEEPLPRDETSESYGDDFDTYKESQGAAEPAAVYTQPVEGLDLEAWIPKIRELILPNYGAKGLNKPVKCAEHVYLGDNKAAKNVKLLEDTGIASIFNCAPEQCRTSAATYQDTDFKYYEIIALDAADYPLLDRHLPEAMQAVQSARDNNHHVLIHCFQGVNRSASLVVACMMALDKTPLQEALATCHQARPVILQNNDGFLSQLITYAYKHGLLLDA
eukprot:TRINITY_DN4556_c0_g1_i1.p1 TRINITY_DN4556_c0_g1~~TRINITY_DN4556_c0_g1_i1.p1  ORF type:complete len:484 (+),score=156.46 TRINITY_DN4556_c0_g1_i1:124-1575(+)